MKRRDLERHLRAWLPRGWRLKAREVARPRDPGVCSPSPQRDRARIGARNLSSAWSASTTELLAAEQRRQANLELEKRAFFNSPAGLARTAFDEKDHVFQCAFDVMSQEAIIVAMVGSRTTKKTSGPTAILNSVCREGWELVTGSFVFVEEGSQSRDKFMSSGQNVAVKGRTMGYYLFKRCEVNAEPRVNPWEQESVQSGVAEVEA